MGGKRIRFGVDRKLFKAFRNQRDRAAERGIGFLLTYEEWLKIWTESGFLVERGRGANKYCMSRHGDIGPYAVGNVKIKTNNDNGTEGSLGRWHLEETKIKIGAGNKGKIISPETRLKISLAKTGKPSGSKGKPRKPHSEEWKLRVSSCLKGRVSKRKGRTFHNVHRLTKEEVVAVRHLYASGIYIRVIKSRFGVSGYTIWRAINDRDYGREKVS